jgi:small subunit ribosomal protein S1
MTTDKPSVREPTFAELFEASLEAAPPGRFEEGQEVSGKVLQMGGEWTFVDIGAKGEAVIATAELLDHQGHATVQMGETLVARVLRQGPEGIVLSRILGGGSQGKRILEEAHELGMPVEGVVKAVIKGGLEVEVAGVRAFCPASQISLRYVEDLTEFLERKLPFRVMEYRDQGRSVVLSRKALLAEERAKQAEQTRAKLEVGAVLPGRVSSIRDFGAFVDLGGVEGLLHVSEISHRRVERAQDVLQPGQELQVQILKMEGDRLSLSLKSLQGDPWDTVAEQFPEGTRLQGRVVRLQPFGAFVELAPGIDGLLHVSTLDDPRVRDARRAFEEGQTVDVTVVSVDPSRQRIGLAPADRRRGGAADVGVSLTPGAVVTGTVERVEHYGVFLRLPGATDEGRAPRGLLPREEIRDAPEDLRRRYPIGQEVRVQLLEPDEKGRLRLSERAVAAADERALAAQYLDAGPRTQGGAGAGGGFGTLGDLLKNRRDR